MPGDGRSEGGGGWWADVYGRPVKGPGSSEEGAPASQSRHWTGVTAKDSSGKGGKVAEKKGGGSSSSDGQIEEMGARLDRLKREA